MRAIGLVVAATLWGCDGGGASAGEVEEILALEADLALGADVYLARCALCHGDAGEGASGPVLQGSTLAAETFIEVILDGIGGMSGFRDSLTQQEVADLYGYIEATVVPGTM